MTLAIRVGCRTYRTDLLSVRSNFLFNRTAGQYAIVQVECGPPDNDTACSVDIAIRRSDVYVVGFANKHGGVKFFEDCPPIKGKNFIRTEPIKLNYTVLGIWNVATSYAGAIHFHNAIFELASVTAKSKFSALQWRSLCLMMFVVSEALRFREIEETMERAICGKGVFRFPDWKEKVNRWKKLSGGPEKGILDGVYLPAIAGDDEN